MADAGTSCPRHLLHGRFCPGQGSWRPQRLLDDRSYRSHPTTSDAILLERNTLSLHIVGQLAPPGHSPWEDHLADMPPNVRYHGAVHFNELPGWLASMDVGLCLYQPGPADYSSPVKLYDYLASGLAVCATDQEQVREVLTPIGGTELLLRPGDASGLAGVLSDLAAEPDRVHALGEAGRRAVEREHTWCHVVGRVLGEIETVRGSIMGTMPSPGRG